MGVLGFKGHPPERWNRWWIAMWFACTALLIALAFVLPFWPHLVVATGPLFFVPEVTSLVKRNDGLPPLTHTIRHFLPNWFAFPAIYFLVGSVGANAVGFAYPRNLHVGGLFALLGWLTDHFIRTYDRPDPAPFSSRADADTGAPSEEPRLAL